MNATDAIVKAPKYFVGIVYNQKHTDNNPHNLQSVQVFISKKKALEHARTNARDGHDVTFGRIMNFNEFEKEPDSE